MFTLSCFVFYGGLKLYNKMSALIQKISDLIFFAHQDLACFRYNVLCFMEHKYYTTARCFNSKDWLFNIFSMFLPVPTPLYPEYRALSLNSVLKSMKSADVQQCQ